MAEYSDRESFIPYRRSDIVDFCIQDSGWNDTDASSFRQFYDILAAHLHFRFHATFETLKDAFAPVNPDQDTVPRQPWSSTEQLLREEKMLSEFRDVLRRANYRELSERDLHAALETESLIPLNTFVDFRDYEPGRVVMYYRGQHQETIERRDWLRKKTKTIDVFERIVLLIKFKPESHFKKKKKFDRSNFIPGKMYLYLYKKVPKHDLDILFPNVDVSMNWKDKLKFFVPAFGGLIPVIAKTLPNLLLIVGVILFFTVGPEIAASWGTDERVVHNFLPLMTAVLSLGFVLGGFAVRQYLNYKNKRLKFLKNVTDTLFFKNIDCNMGVLSTVLDAAEEEETKEILLVYYFILRHPGLTRGEIDDRIEQWLEEKFGTRIDFDIDKALAHARDVAMDDRQLVYTDSSERYHALSVPDAKQLIDRVWDHAFQYNTVLNT